MAIRCNSTFAFILLASAWAAHPARAADTAAASTLEEIVVTAQKRAGSVQDTPFSVSATSQEQIRNSGAGNITDFARNVAGLSISDLGPRHTQGEIRVISSGLGI